jgi:8-amino-7-oxononanoate synthase
MSDFDSELERRLNAICEQGLHRQLRRVDSPQSARIEVEGRPLLNFSSNDYLGLAGHPALKEATIRAVEKFGSGSGASRLICGSLAPHHELEEALAAFKGTEAALTFSSGYVTAVGALPALVDKDDVVAVDKLIHASLVDAARLTGAKLRVFKHNDLEDLERILNWTAHMARVSKHALRTLIVTESVFSMDGDLAPLRDIVALKEKYGAWLMVDEAHATGLYGEHRRGLVEESGVSGHVEVQMGTLGKALGSAGGYIAGSRALIDLLVNRARSFIFSTAPVPAQAAAAMAAVRLLQSAEGEERRVALWRNVDQLKNALVGGPWKLPVVRSAILPLMVGGEDKAVATAAALRDAGLFVPAIRFPTVARGEARLRVTFSASHTADDLAALATALRGAHESPSASV